MTDREAKDCIRRIRALQREGNDGDAADALRDRLDEWWDAASEDARAELRRYSASLA